VIDREAYPWTGRFMELPSGRMHYLDEGTGEPIFFVHGTPTWSFEWRHLIRAFAPTHRCIAPDLLGFGLSERPRDFAYTPEAHARALADFVDRLDPPPFTLVVHDYGGPVGLPICLDQPGRVSRLVLINTWMWSFEDDRDMVWKARLAGGRVGRFLYRRLNFSLRAIMPSAYGERRKLTPEIHRQYLERFRDPWSRGTVLWALARALLGSSSYYDSLWARRDVLRGRPTRIIWGMKDPAFTPRALARWERELPEAHVLRLDRAGHWPHEEEPEAVIEVLRRLLAQSSDSRI
jgi:haloalkane dehalogenase